MKNIKKIIKKMIKRNLKNLIKNISKNYMMNLRIKIEFNKDLKQAAIQEEAKENKSTMNIFKVTKINK